MNISLDRSYHQIAVKGMITQPLRLPQTQITPQDILQKYWQLNALDFYISLDKYLTDLKKQSRNRIANLKIDKKQQWQVFNMSSLVDNLKEWLKIIKKQQFYRIEGHMKDLLYDEQGLLNLYEYGNMQTIYLLSQIQKYRQKNSDEQSTTIRELRKDQTEIIFKDVCLKICKHLLTELKNQMYYPSKQLTVKILKFYGLNYDYLKSFEENYQIALAQKKVSIRKQSRESIIIFFTLKMIYSIQQLQGLCFYLSYLKNILLDRSNGILTAEYDTWLMLYETCLKIYARYEKVRQNQYIEIDQILSSSLVDSQFQHFMLKNASNDNVALGSINFYIKNCKREQKQQLKSCILSKIEDLMNKKFWKYAEDIYQYIENQLQGQEKGKYVRKLIAKLKSLIYEDITDDQVYEVEYGLTFIIENTMKYIRNFDDLLSEIVLKDIQDMIKTGTSPKLLILFRVFNQFISTSYLEAHYQNWRFPQIEYLLNLIKMFMGCGFICSKSVYKFVYYIMSSDEFSQQTWDLFLGLLSQQYFCGGYDQNSDLELIHSHQTYKQCLSAKILQKFQSIAFTQMTERKQLVKCYENKIDLDVKASYFVIKGFKDNLMFNSIQNICLIFNSHLSMQTLEFGLNYYTPFGHISSWDCKQGESILSLICQEMPIQTLKFIFKQIGQEQNLDSHVYEQIPAKFWSYYWRQDRRKCATLFSEQKVSIEHLDALQKLRRLQFILNISCCVFDKLNENSQKNIKEIKIIYQKGAAKLIQIAKKLKKLFVQGMVLSITEQTQDLVSQQIKNIQLINQENGSFIITNYISKNGFLDISLKFNLIGKINCSKYVSQVQQALLPSFIDLKNLGKDKKYELLSKEMELCLTLESSFISKLSQSEQFVFQLQMNKQWAKQITITINTINGLLKKYPTQLGDCSLQSRINQHIKQLLSKYLLPQTLTLLLTGECKQNLSKNLYFLMKSSIELIYTIDPEFEQHFIILIEKLQDLIKQNKTNNKIQSPPILSLLQLFFELIFNKIRIRSYHLYRIIKHYQKIANQGIEQFNYIISQQIRLLFEQFITNYKNINVIQQLCAPKKIVNPLYAKFVKQEYSLNFIQIACTLSMFVNLFCRLNYSSLAAGVEKIFCQEQAKAIYIDYLNSLTRKIVTEKIEISERDLEILKIDVYGNLTIITKGKLSERLLNKIVSLAKNLLRVKIELKGVNKLPIKILADKITTQQIEINLEEFEDQCKAISLGAISVHKKLSVYVTSNLHLCNIFYVTGRNFQKYIQLNQVILGRCKQEINQQVAKIAKNGFDALNICIGEELQPALENLIKKLQKYYEVSLKDSQYVQKLYSVFKILCISCLNNPEIIPLLLMQKMWISKLEITFYDFIFETLKVCLPLFCQFYTALIKTNSGFSKVSDDIFISNSLQLEIQIRKKLLSLFKTEILKPKTQYQYLAKAISYVIQFSESNRFRFYKFAKNTNEMHESILKEFEKDFNFQLIKICQEYIKTENYQSINCSQIYLLLEISMDKYYMHGYQLDYKKVMTEDEIKKIYYHGKKDNEANKQNEGDRRCESPRQKYIDCQSPRLKSNETFMYKHILQKVINNTDLKSPAKVSISKGKKLKDVKHLRLNHIQEDIINLSDCKFILIQWTSNNFKYENKLINKIMVQKFLYFNEEIENRQFMKDAIVFPSKNGLEIVTNTNYIPAVENNEETGDTIKQKVDDSIIQSLDNIYEGKSCEQFSDKLIQQSQPLGEIIQQPPQIIINCDSIIYSQIEIENCEDGSMKLFGQQQEQNHQEEDQIQQVTKNDIIQLIQDYGLNPEAIKQILFKIKFVGSNQLQTLYSQQSGQIAYVIQAQLRNRGILIVPERAGKYQYFFMDQSKIYERVRTNRRFDEKDLMIPLFTKSFLKEWFKTVLKISSQQKNGNLTKHLSNFCKKMLLEVKNIQNLITEALVLITTDNNEFEVEFQQLLTFNKLLTPLYYKQILVDQIFGLMIEHRIALPIIFFGEWDCKNKSVGTKTSQQKKSAPIIQILIDTLINSNQRQSQFLINLKQYTQILNKVTKYQYPYYEIQDSIIFSSNLVQKLSQKMHFSSETFHENDKFLNIFKVMVYLNIQSFQQFLKISLVKITDVVKKIYNKEDHIIQIFKKNYCNDEQMELERKAQIYWQLRKSKNADQFNSELIFCRKLLTDIASIVFENLKQNCFTMYYKSQDLKMKQQLAYLKRSINQSRHYTEKYQLQNQFKQKEKRYVFWRKNLINLIIVEEITPAVDTVGIEFLEEIKKTPTLLTNIYFIFSEIAKNIPIIFRQSAEFYKLILAFQLIKKQQEQTYHSMSVLKTLPSIQSTRQMAGGRRRSSLIGGGRNSIIQPNCVDLTTVIRKSAMMFSYQSLMMEPKDPLFGMHAKCADTETKIKYLKQQNTLGQKIIQVSRDNLWADTAPHLDENFGNYDIKIKITGQLGIDYGGLTREWITLIVKQILNPKLGLFQLNVNQLAFQPSKFSYLVPNHLSIFEKFGILVGKAMKENWLLQINFTKSFLKHMLGALLYVEDLQDIQPDTAKGLLWILKNYVDQDIGLNFTYQEEILQTKKTVQLVPGGSQVFVNQSNKKEYVKKLAYAKMTQRIREQSLAFISGVEKVIPIHMLKLFNYRQIGKYLAGVSTIDVIQMKKYAKYEGYTQVDENINWFWEVMASKSQQDKAQFLFFLTGSYRVPYSGFKDNPITINKMIDCRDYLPVAHTCFSIIDFPEYTSYEKLDRMLFRAVKQGKGFTVS